MDKEILDSVYKQIVNQKEETLKTGFLDLDEYIKLVEKGSIITIGGRPAMGKTAFMTSILRNLLNQGKKCLYISLDMSSGQLIKKLMCQISEIETHKINLEENREKLADSLTVLSDYNLLIYDESSKLNNIKEAIEKAEVEFVFIDYVQLIDIKTKRPRSEAITTIMQELKELAKETKRIFFITSSLSRAIESRMDKRPMLSDLRDSGSIEEFSDVVMFIYRDEYYNAQSENKGKAEIIVAKNKFGPVGIIELLFRKAITKFYSQVRNNDF